VIKKYCFHSNVNSFAKASSLNIVCHEIYSVRTLKSCAKVCEIFDALCQVNFVFIVYIGRGLFDTDWILLLFKRGEFLRTRVFERQKPRLENTFCTMLKQLLTECSTKLFATVKVKFRVLESN